MINNHSLGVFQARAERFDMISEHGATEKLRDGVTSAVKNSFPFPYGYGCDMAVYRSRKTNA